MRIRGRLIRLLYFQDRAGVIVACQSRFVSYWPSLMRRSHTSNPQLVTLTFAVF